jgi:hypothetical protein
MRKDALRLAPAVLLASLWIAAAPGDNGFA